MLFLMKAMIWHFVSDFNKVTISFIVLQIFDCNIMDMLLHKENSCIIICAHTIHQTQSLCTTNFDWMGIVFGHKNSVWHFNFVVKLSNFMISQHTKCFYYSRQLQKQNTQLTYRPDITSDPACCWTWDWKVQASRGHVACTKTCVLFHH